jgi:putative aldouronate transport system substrate-binding protein
MFCHGNREKYNYFSAGSSIQLYKHIGIGIEGESYALVNGYPAYTDKVMNHPQGWPPAQSLSAYTRANYNGPFPQDGRYIEQYQALPEQKNALTVWSIPESINRVVPPLTPTPEESREYAAIMTEIGTYAEEMLTKFVIGTESLSRWDAYVDTINRLGLPRALEIQNNALGRYSRR